MGKTHEVERGAGAACVKIVASSVYFIGAVGFVGSVIVAANVGAFLFDFKTLGCAPQHHGAHGDNLESMHKADLMATVQPNENRMLIGVLVFSLAYMNAALFLVYAAVTRRSFLAYPWLMCEAVTFFLQMGAVMCPYDFPGATVVNSSDMWKNVMLIFLTLYVIVVVMIAQTEWNRERKIMREVLLRSRGHLIFVTGIRTRHNDE